MRQLKQDLLAVYGHFADKRIKKLERGSTFIVDDRGPNDVGADRHLYPTFCMVFAEVKSASEVEVKLYGNVPDSPTVRAWAQKTGAVLGPGRPTRSLAFTVTEPSLGKLVELVAAVSAIVERGAPRYAVASYKYVCPRTARSLLQLRSALASSWSRRN
jgi:hypothetical protein